MQKESQNLSSLLEEAKCVKSSEITRKLRQILQYVSSAVVMMEALRVNSLLAVACWLECATDQILSFSSAKGGGGGCQLNISVHTSCVETGKTLKDRAKLARLVIVTLTLVMLNIFMYFTPQF